MADTQTAANPPTAQKNSPGGSSDAGETARKVAESIERQGEKAGRAAEQVAEKAREANREAAQANREIFRRNMETAQEAVRVGLEAGVKSVENLTQTVSRAFGVVEPNNELAEQSAQNVRAISQASTVLARGAQQASRVWLELIQQGVRTNLEALNDFARCRSAQDVMALQSKVVCQNLKAAIDSGQSIAQTSSHAMEEAGRALLQSAHLDPRR